LNLSFWRCLSQKLPGKRKVSRNNISRKFAHFRIIFAFRENLTFSHHFCFSRKWKKTFSFQPYLGPKNNEYFMISIWA
jgi:hypothetical protein